MDKSTIDLLTNGKDFAIEKMYYPGTLTMGNSHYHSHYEMLYVLSGEKNIVINNYKSIKLTRDNIALIPPNVMHRTSSSNNISHNRILINISQTLMNKLTGINSETITSCFDALVLELTSYESKTLNYFLEMLVSADPNSLLYHEYTTSLLSLILINLSNIHLSSESRNSIPISHNNTKTNMKLIYDYICKNYSTNIDCAGLAALINTSESYLSRCFKKQYGLSPIKLLNQYRIATAQRLLQSDTVNVSEVAFSCGFNDATTFTRMFKLQVGMTPKEYQLYVRKLRQNSG